jgi:CBS domain-containing protein
MRPVDATLFVQASATMARADELMRQNGLGALAVIDHAGRLVGYLQQGRLRKVKSKIKN